MKYTKEQLYNNVYIVDIEATGLLEDNPSIHILSCRFLGSSGWTTMSTTNLDDMRRIFEEPDNIVVGHFFKSYDINVLKLNIPDMEVNCEIIDTLPLSQYLFENMMSHGLEAFGKIYGTLKTEVSKDQWQGLTTEQLEYMWELEALEQRSPTEEVAFQDLFMQYSDHKELMKERCEGDVLINQKLWHDILNYLFELYDGSEEDVNRVINKTNFKMDQLQGQYDNPIKLDLEFTQKSHDTLEEIYTGKKQALEAHMPEVPKYVKKSKPKVMEKKDGTLSSNGKKWYDLLEDLGLQKDEEGPIEYIASYEEPNAGSPNQLKDFLLGLGWQPKEHKDGANGPVPQVMVDEDGVKVLCPNIIKMIPQYPFLENLQGMSVAKHRLGIVKGFLKNDIGGGWIRGQWSGIAATWRVKHQGVVNLPSNRSQYGEYIRKCLVAPEGYVWMNADLSSLEDKTKQNCIINLDPEYVKTLNVKGFDAHLNLGLLAGMFTQEEVDFFKWYKGLTKEQKKTLEGIEKFESFRHFSADEAYKFSEILAVRRQAAKTVNYSATYGVGAAKLAASADITLKEAKKILNTYWELNWSVKEFAESLPVKEVRGQKFIWSPYSRLWLVLRSDHMKFSVVNQNFGATVFDVWLYFITEMGYKCIYQCHDELSVYVEDTPEARELAAEAVQIAIDKTNEVFNLPVKFEAEPEFAYSYGDVH